jgi:hypothetical protein
MKGYSRASLTLAVYKQTHPSEFAFAQAGFMMYLGEQICPKILMMNNNSYVMEYLPPYSPFVDPQALLKIEQALEQHVWNRSLDTVPYAKLIGDESWREELATSINVEVPDWAMDEPCLIHGDPTIDNVLMAEDGPRITDPIPPHWLKRPSIKAVDHAKMLQSFLGWEAVLRGTPKIDYKMPNFMMEYKSARRAVFWCIVALKRIALRNNTGCAGVWAEDLAKELMKCEL